MRRGELLAPVWGDVNCHLGTTRARCRNSSSNWVIARYGHRPKVADTFCGGGSIPFEAARVGCDVYASDLNPVACMLTWGAFNIIGASKEKRAEIDAAQRRVAAAVDAEITRLGIEHDAKATAPRLTLLPGDPLPKDGLDGADGTVLGCFQDAQSCREVGSRCAAKRYTSKLLGVSAAEMAEPRKVQFAMAGLCTQ